MIGRGFFYGDRRRTPNVELDLFWRTQIYVNGQESRLFEEQGHPVFLLRRQSGLG